MTSVVVGVASGCAFPPEELTSVASTSASSTSTVVPHKEADCGGVSDGLPDLTRLDVGDETSKSIGTPGCGGEPLFAVDITGDRKLESS